jgi:hypothetical protein
MGVRSDNLTNTPAPYRFIIESGLGNEICDREPLEWKEGVNQLDRRLMDGGVFNTFQIASLTFIGSGAALLRKNFNAFEVNAEAFLKVQYFDFESFSYVDFPTRYSFVFGSYKVKKVGKFAFGVNIEVINSSILAKLTERRNIKVNVLRRRSIGEMTIPELEGEPENYRLRIPDLKSTFWSVLTSQKIGGEIWYIQNGKNRTSPDTFTFTAPPLTKRWGNVETVYDVPFATLKSEAQIFTDIQPAFVNTVGGERTLNIRAGVGVYVIDGAGQSASINPYYAEIRQYDASGTLVDTRMFYEFGRTSEAFRQGSINYTATVGAGHKLFLLIRVQNRSSIAADVRNASFEVKEQVADIDSVIIEGLPIYEAWEAVCQHIFDQPYAFYSEFFGRIGKKFNATDSYEDENVEAFAHICAGTNVRGLPIDIDQSNISFSFDELYRACSAIWNIGYTVEVINGVPRLRVEPYEYFFDAENVAIDFSDQLTNFDIESEYMPELAFIEIQNGFENFDYKATNGRGEYNTKVTRTLPVKATERKDLTSPFRADTMGIVNALSTPLADDGSKDIEEDKNIFIIKSQREEAETNDWLAETNELIQIENDSSLFQDSSLNLYFSPARCFVRNANKLVSSLTKQLSARAAFQTSDKLQTLETTGEGYTVKENQDFIINDLPRPLFRPVKHTAEVVLTQSELSTILASPFSLCKFTKDLKGYILSVKKKNAEDKATIEIIEIYEPE